MAKIFGFFGTKTCSFIKENRTQNGPLVFRTVLFSKHDEKQGNCQRKKLRQKKKVVEMRLHEIINQAHPESFIILS